MIMSNMTEIGQAVFEKFGDLPMNEPNVQKMLEYITARVSASGLRCVPVSVKPSHLGIRMRYILWRQKDAGADGGPELEVFYFRIDIGGGTVIDKLISCEPRILMEPSEITR